MTPEEYHTGKDDYRAGYAEEVRILDLDSSHYRLLPEEPTFSDRMHDFASNIGSRLKKFREEIAYQTEAERALLRDLRPDKVWHRFWSSEVSRAERVLMSSYTASLLAGASAGTVSAREVASQYNLQNAAVYQMSAEELRQMHDPSSPDEGTTAIPKPIYLPWAVQPVPRNPASPTPKATLLPTATDTPTPGATETPAIPTLAPSPTAEPPTPTREIPPLERYSRVPLVAGIDRIENPGQDTTNLDFIGEEWGIIGSGFRANDFAQRGRVISFTASNTDLPPTPRPPSWPTPSPNQRPTTEAAQIFISQDHNHIVGPIYYEGGYWFLNGERFAVEPGSEPEDPHAELYYYLDDQGNLKVELRTQGSDVALGALVVALAQGGTEGAPLPVINARVRLMPNQGLVKDVAVDGLVQYDFLKGQESNQPSLKDALSQAGAGKVYLFEGEAQAGDPLDSEYEYSSENEIHNKLLVDPELVGFLEDGKAGGIIWREAQGNFAQHYGGSDQMKALADRYDTEIFISSGHQFRNPASWTGSQIIKSERDHYRGFVSLIKEMVRNYRNRYPRQDNLNPIVIDRPLTQDGETGVIPRDKLSYEYAFEGHPQEDNAPGPMMETAAEAAPKGKNEEWGTKFAVYESLGLSREGRSAKLQGFFKKFGLDKADVPPRSYALIIDEFMLEEDFFTSETFLTRFNELQASNPDVRIIIALRPYGIWTRYATSEHIADAITPLLQLMVDGKVDIGLGRTLLANPAIEARIRALTEEKAKAQGAPTPEPTPEAGELIPLPNNWKAQPQRVRAPRKPKGTFARQK